MGILFFGKIVFTLPYCAQALKILEPVDDSLKHLRGTGLLDLVILIYMPGRRMLEEVIESRHRLYETRSLRGEMLLDRLQVKRGIYLLIEGAVEGKYRAVCLRDVVGGIVATEEE